jgi:hypothetical protein
MHPNTHRHPDGSIDYDFYRRVASRRRQLARRVVLRRWIMLTAAPLVWQPMRIAVSFSYSVCRAVLDFRNTPAIRLSDRFR